MNADVVRARVVVSGRVQGVFFRAETREMARGLDIAGWAANRIDGTVEIVLEGNEKFVRQAIEWCGRGPATARVDNVDIRWEAPEGERGFKILATGDERFT
ncbi:MAG: acylphosphatase [Candidatus Anoxymicrobium japonicum]|uniref:Acylphosphatase n=1 Tax=Candidatus Anoxymicrobium japonicum TaxID=2013648 RepID=A0A2N3G7A5_9ACTN|nr:MAG: acylphosphatase [Candidatus Anoxymicrobium japonicum]